MPGCSVSLTPQRGPQNQPGSAVEQSVSAPQFPPRQEHGDTIQVAGAVLVTAVSTCVPLWAKPRVRSLRALAGSKAEVPARLWGGGLPVQGPVGEAQARPGARRCQQLPTAPTRGPSSWSVSASLRRYVHAQGSDARHGRQPGPVPASRRAYPA